MPEPDVREIRMSKESFSSRDWLFSQAVVRHFLKRIQGTEHGSFPERRESWKWVAIRMLDYVKDSQALFEICPPVSSVRSPLFLFWSIREKQTF
jgi:hypothetical protein